MSEDRDDLDELLRAASFAAEVPPAGLQERIEVEFRRRRRRQVAVRFYLTGIAAAALVALGAWNFARFPKAGENIGAAGPIAAKPPESPAAPQVGPLEPPKIAPKPASAPPEPYVAQASKPRGGWVDERNRLLAAPVESKTPRVRIYWHYPLHDGRAASKVDRKEGDRS